MKTVKLIVLLLCICALLCGCSVSSAAGEPYNIWFIAKSTDTEFWKAAFAGANAAKSEYNTELTICGPSTEEDYETQNGYIAEAVESGADALIFSSISYTENAAAIDSAAKSGLKVVVIDSDVGSEHVSARIGTDNVLAGRMAAAAALDSDKTEFVVGIVNYDLGSRNGQEREQGFRAALAEDGRTRDIYTINVLTTAAAAKSGAISLLKEHPEINIIVAFNEPLTVGVAQAVDELGLGGKVRMVGFDTNVICVDLMQTGAVTALIAQNPYAMGYLGLETAWRLLEGESYSPDELIDTSTVTITRENMFTPESQKALFPFS